MVELKATWEKRVNKDGKPYDGIFVQISPGVEKMVFLNSAEKALLELQFGKLD